MFADALSVSLWKLKSSVKYQLAMKYVESVQKKSINLSDTKLQGRKGERKNDYFIYDLPTHCR